VETRSVVESRGAEVLTETRSIQRAASLLRSCYRRIASSRDGDHNDTIPQRLLARQERICDNVNDGEADQIGKRIKNSTLLRSIRPPTNYNNTITLAF
jgi:hypothetical protein